MATVVDCKSQKLSMYVVCDFIDWLVSFLGLNATGIVGCGVKAIYVCVEVDMYLSTI